MISTALGSGSGSPSFSDYSDSDVSFLSRSPTPPPGLYCSFASKKVYISPSSSQQSSAKASPAPEAMPSPPSSNEDDQPPRKRRKVLEPKERIAAYLDLSVPQVAAEEHLSLQRLLKVLHKKRKIVVIAGAGISVSAGIPDFRSTTGLFKTLKKEHKLKSSGKDLFDASVYSDAKSTSTFHDMVRTLSQQTKSAQPTAFHHLLATLAQEGRLMRLYTQNVDGIDTSLTPLSTQVPLPKKGPWPRTVQVHGGLDHMVCSKCHITAPLDAGLFNGPTPPPCPICEEMDTIRQVAEKRSHGIGCLRPRMVLYNEHNPDDEAIGSCATYDMRMRPDAVIVAGTTLKVPGVRRIAREMCNIVKDRRDGVTIWLNNDPEPIGKDLEDLWDLVVKGPCDRVAHYANMRRWNDPVQYKEVSDQDLNKVKEKQKAEVIIGSSQQSGVVQCAGQLTPTRSPHISPQSTFPQELTDLMENDTEHKLDTQTILFGKTVVKQVPKKPRAPRKSRKGTSKAEKAQKEAVPGIRSTFKITKSHRAAVVCNSCAK